MNIGIDLRPLDMPHRTGVGEYTAGFLTALFQADTVNQYFLLNQKGAKKEWLQPNVHYCSSHWSPKILHTAIAVADRPHLDEVIKKQTGVRLDYFFSPNLHFTALAKTTPHILMIHDLSFHLFQYFYTPKQRLWHALTRPRAQCERAQHIIVPSENTKRDIVDYYQINPGKITVLYPAPSPNTASPLQATSYKLPAGITRPYILYLGTLEPRKNIIGIIDAFEQIYSLLPLPYALVLAGAPGWQYKTVLKCINSSPRKNQIKIIGYVSPADKAALYHDASLFVYPSFYEGFGLPVLEAMNAGVPVITSNRSSLPEVTGSAAYLVNPHRTDEIAAGMKYLLTNSAARESAIKNGLEQAAKFSWEKTVERWLGLLV